MNRTIKFRIWDKNTQKMLYYPENRAFIINDLYLAEEDKRYVFMQFTGLTDKNGKEIYEGDIVQIEDEYDTYIREVKWEKGGYTFDIWEDFAPLISDEALTLEVFGNIYTNSQLLNANPDSL